MFFLNSVELTNKHRFFLLVAVILSLACNKMFLGLAGIILALLCMYLIKSNEVRNRCFFGVLISIIFFIALSYKKPIYFVSLMFITAHFAYKEAIELFNKSFNYKYNTILATLYAVLPCVLLTIIKFNKIGVPIIIWAISIVISSDVGAFFFGRLIGGKKLCPKISPNKTISGFVGGVLCATATAVLLFFAVEINITTLANFIVLSVVLSAVSVAGDIFESWLKRRAGVKDSSNLIPYHGGVLDRADSIIPVVIVLYFFCL